MRHLQAAGPRPASGTVHDSAELGSWGGGDPYIDTHAPPPIASLQGAASYLPAVRTLQGLVAGLGSADSTPTQGQGQGAAPLGANGSRFTYHGAGASLAGGPIGPGRWGSEARPDVPQQYRNKGLLGLAACLCSG